MAPPNRFLTSYFWLSHLGIFLVGTMFVSWGVLALWVLRHNTPLFESINQGTPPASTADTNALHAAGLLLPPRALGLETAALIADTTITFGLIAYSFGSYAGWGSLDSVLPEIYLVLLLVGRRWTAAEMPDLSAHLQLHSALLYGVRWVCAVLASTFSTIHSPKPFNVYLGTARVVLLTTLVVTHIAAS